MDTEALWTATKEKYQGQFEHVRRMRVRDKRSLFAILRKSDEISPDTFLPSYGMHCGEFACFQILAEHNRKEAKSRADAAMAPGAVAQ